jgi:hypothetical protein
MNEDELDKLPEASAEDHTFVWSMGDMNDSLVVQDWRTAALEMAVRTEEGEGRMPAVVLKLEGVLPGNPARLGSQLIMIPLDITEAIGATLIEYAEKIRSNNKARIVANNDPPKERT